jgi:hypothetical protein
MAPVSFSDSATGLPGITGLVVLNALRVPASSPVPLALMGSFEVENFLAAPAAEASFRIAVWNRRPSVVSHRERLVSN